MCTLRSGQELSANKTVREEANGNLKKRRQEVKHRHLVSVIRGREPSSEASTQLGTKSTWYHKGTRVRKKPVTESKNSSRS